MKNRGHRARSRAKEHCTCLLGLFIEKQYHVLGMRALICLITCFYAQYKMPSAILRNHL